MACPRNRRLKLLGHRLEGERGLVPASQQLISKCEASHCMPAADDGIRLQPEHHVHAAPSRVCHA
jgi:hypothetical protein